METDPTRDALALLVGLPTVAVVGVAEWPGWLRIVITTSLASPNCCGVVAHRHGVREVELVDLLMFGRPAARQAKVRCHRSPSAPSRSAVRSTDRHSSPASPESRGRAQSISATSARERRGSGIASTGAHGERMERGAVVVEDSGNGELARAGAATDRVGCFQRLNVDAMLCKTDGGGEAVGPGADHHRGGHVCHAARSQLVSSLISGYTRPSGHGFGTNRPPLSSTYVRPQLHLSASSSRLPHWHTHPILRAGFPATRAYGTTSRFTTEPAAMKAYSPMLMPHTIVAFAPIVAPR